MKEEYVIINKTAVLKRMKELENRIIHNPFFDSGIDNYNMVFFAKQNELNEILAKSTPLIPEIEKALKVSIPIYQEHTLDEAIKITEDYQKWYISNLKLDI